MARTLANPTPPTQPQRSRAKASRRRPRSTPTTAPGAQTRAAAAQVLVQVLVAGRSLTAALAPYSALPGSEESSEAPQPPERLSARDRPLLHELSFGVLRSLPRLDALIARLLQRPLKARDQDVQCLLRVGLYQLDALALPDHAAVAATVGATAMLEKPWARGLVNATLRRFVRERDELCASIVQDPVANSLMPAWLLARLQAAWPDHWKAIVAASNSRAPMFLRVNRQRLTAAAYQHQLSTAGITATPVPGCTEALQLDQPVPVSQLPGFQDGLVSVQDAGAQRAAALLCASPGQRVLDACAAPGGKSAHLQELAANQLQLTALDQDAERLHSLRSTLERLGLQADIQQADATVTRGPWAERRYDRILLDAPCSGTGVIRRHPDIKWLRREQDIAALARTQARLLDALWPLLKPQGLLLYITCSVLPEENEQQISAFLARHPEACEDPIPEIAPEITAAQTKVHREIARAHGCQRLPGLQGSDGFFFARLLKP